MDFRASLKFSLQLINDFPTHPRRIVQLNYHYILSLDSVDLLGERGLLLSSLDSQSGGILLGQGSSQSSGLLGSQVLWKVLLASVESSDVLSLSSVDHSQHSSNVLSDGTDLWNGRSGQLLHLQRGQLLLQLSQLLLQLFLGLGFQFSNFDGLMLVGRRKKKKEVR